MHRLMTEHEKQLDGNLRAIGRITPRPPEASEEQIRRWVTAVRSVAPVRRALQFPVRTGPLLRRAALTAAAVILAVGAFLAFRATPRNVSAEEVFRQVAGTLAGNPVLHLTVQGVELNGNRIDLEFFGAEQGRTMYAHVDAATIPGEGDHDLGLNLTLARDEANGWVLVRRMQWRNCRPMEHLLPPDGALLIDVPISRGTDEALRQVFPVMVQPREVQSLIESLRQAVPDLKLREQPDGIVLLEGVITQPEQLDLRMLCETTDAARMMAGVSPALMSGMTEEDLRRVVQTVKETLRKRLSEEDYQAVSQRIDVVSLVAMRQLRDGGADKSVSSPSERFRDNLRALLTGATLAITYDPALRRLRSVAMENVGPAGGSIRLRLDEPGVDRALLDRSRFATESNLRTLTRDEVIAAMLLPMLAPSSPAGEK